MKKPKKLKPLKMPKQMRNLLKTGKVSTGALNKLRGTRVSVKPVRGVQISVKAPRGGVGKGMAGM